MQEKARRIVMEYFNEKVDKKETYLDVYKKWENVRIPD